MVEDNIMEIMEIMERDTRHMDRITGHLYNSLQETLLREGGAVETDVVEVEEIGVHHLDQLRLEMVLLASTMLLTPKKTGLQARGVSTKWRWSRRPSTTR
jgi:hypothetical protein